MPTNKFYLAFVIGSMKFGGAERAILNLVNALCKMGYQIDLVLIDGKGEFLPLINEEVKVIDLQSKRSVFAFRKFSKYLSKNNPDGVIAIQNHVQLMVLICTIISKYKGKIVLNEQSTFSENLNGLKGFFQKGLSKILFPMADKLITVSEGVKVDMIRHFPRLTDRIEVIYNPIVATNVSPSSNSSPDHPFFNSDKKVIIAAGRLTKSKNFELLIKAFRLVNNNNEFHLLILGDGEERNNLILLAKKFKIDHFVSLPGFVSDPLTYFSKADLFVLSSNFEGLPGVLIEALSCGCKIVSTNCNFGPSEILENGKFGRLVPVNNVDALAKSILLALSEKNDPFLLKKRANDFNIETISSRYDDFFKKLLETSNSE